MTLNIKISNYLHIPNFMQCPYPVFVKLLCLRPALFKTSSLSHNCKVLKRFLSLSAQHKFEVADMGKEKVQFQLKTPKGTKDCECLDNVWFTHSPTSR